MSFLKIKGHTDTKTDLTREMSESIVLRCRDIESMAMRIKRRLCSKQALVTRCYIVWR